MKKKSKFRCNLNLNNWAAWRFALLSGFNSLPAMTNLCARYSNFLPRPKKHLHIRESKGCFMFLCGTNAEPNAMTVYLLMCLPVCTALQLPCQNASWCCSACLTVVSFFLLPLVPFLIMNCTWRFMFCLWFYCGNFFPQNCSFSAVFVTLCWRVVNKYSYLTCRKYICRKCIVEIIPSYLSQELYIRLLCRGLCRAPTQ